MKTKIFTLLLVLTTGISTSYAQWNQITMPTNASFDFIECLDGHTCYAAGSVDFGFADLVYKTIDGGENWTNASGNLDPNDSGFQLTCLDANTCFFVNEGGLYKTTDGGANWTLQFSLLFPQGVCFPENLNDGYAIGGNNKIVKTTDGGTNWIELPNYPDVLGFPTLDFYNNQIGLVCAKDNSNTNVQIYKTIDGGTNWILVYDEVANSSAGLSDIQFVDANVAYACGLQGRVLKSTNGGDNWNLLANPNSGVVWYKALDFINATNGYVVAPGKAIKTIDGGNNWIEENGSTGFDVAIGNLDTVYTAGSDVYINVSAGLTVSIQDLQSNKLIGNIYPNPSNEKITITLNENKQGLKFKLLDLLGNELKSIPLTGSQTEIFKEGLASGTYLYQLTENNAVISSGKITFN